MSVLCILPFASYLFAACSTQPLAVGYVEGEFVQLAPLEVAQVQSVTVRRGDRVEPGKPIAQTEDADARIAVAQAEATLAQARAQLADLQVGKRPDEIAVLEAALRTARAQADDARRTLLRTQDLTKRGVMTQAQLDDAATKVEVAEAAVKSAEAHLDSARWHLTKRTIEAPAPGRITDVIRNPGDIAGPSAPVLTMLPDGAVKLKVYIPEDKFAAVRTGDVLSVRCDGCAPGLQARVSYVSSDPEFTPPVIYSLETRQKLVYLVEAHPVDPASPLQPGQIVDVDLASQ